MILDSGEPIDLSKIFLMIRLNAELMYIDLPVGMSAFDHPKGIAAIDGAIQDFPDMIEDHVEREQRIRRGLCWLLHQEDDYLLGIYRTGHDLILASPLMADQRRFLALMWGSGFAEWRAKEFDEELYGVLESRWWFRDRPPRCPRRNLPDRFLRNLRRTGVIPGP